MKNILALVVALMFTFLLSAAFAADNAAETQVTPSPTKDVKKSAAKKHQLTGEVKAVDAKAAIVTIKGKKEMTFSADEKMLKDVKIGDKIVVTYTESDGKAIAAGIKPAKAPKKVEPAAKPAAQDDKSVTKKKSIEGC
ncbi:MAG: hypothetical protein ACLP29_15210 [Dissulfurispiraceae bacterium]